MNIDVYVGNIKVLSLAIEDKKLQRLLEEGYENLLIFAYAEDISDILEALHSGRFKTKRISIMLGYSRDASDIVERSLYVAYGKLKPNSLLEISLSNLIKHADRHSYSYADVYNDLEVEYVLSLSRNIRFVPILNTLSPESYSGVTPRKLLKILEALKIEVSPATKRFLNMFAYAYFFTIKSHVSRAPLSLISTRARQLELASSPRLYSTEFPMGFVFKYWTSRRDANKVIVPFDSILGIYTLKISEGKFRPRSEDVRQEEIMDAYLNGGINEKELFRCLYKDSLEAPSPYHALYINVANIVRSLTHKLLNTNSAKDFERLKRLRDFFYNVVPIPGIKNI